MKRTTLLFCLVLLIMIIGCSRCHKEASHRIGSYNESSGIILMPKPGISPDSVLRFLNKAGLILGKNFTASLEFCLPCDSALFILRGTTYNDLMTYASTDGSGVVKSNPPDPGATGEWGPLLYSLDFNVSIPPLAPLGSISRNNRFDSLISPVEAADNNPPVMVGVVDTGLDSLVAAAFQPSSQDTCFSPGRFGWNFANKTPWFNDNFGDQISTGRYTGHGTPVTGFILQQAAGKVPVQILPAKILRSDGKCGLFEVLCGMAYAKKAGAKIINASFGFYAPYNEEALLFRQFIDSLTKDGVLVIAAAGNANDYEDSMAVNVNKEIAAADVRNLDKHLFFPAAFSETNPNVITVTTILSSSDGTKTVAPRQNFSKSKVQIGVMADNGAKFIDPFAPVRLNTWEGSSFATPIATGLIASVFTNPAQYFDENGKLNRNKLLQTLQTTYPGNGKVQIMASSSENVPAFIVMKKVKNGVAYTYIRRATGAFLRKP